MRSTTSDEFFRDELVRRVSFLRKVGFTRELAQDAAAEAMTCAYESWEAIKSPRGWVRRAAYRAALKQARRAREETLRAVTGSWTVSSHYDADVIEARDEHHQVLELLGQLPPRQRLVMAWHLDGFNHNEISDRLHMSPPTVRSTLRHARARLKEIYQARAEGSGECNEVPLVGTGGRTVVGAPTVQKASNTDERDDPLLRPRDELDALVGAALRGEPHAMDSLLRRIDPLVLRYCRTRLGRQERTFASADDVAQEVCLAVLKALPSFRDQGRPFLAFVYGIAAHKVADAHRAAERNKSDPVPDLPEEPVQGGGPEQRVLQAELADRLLGALTDKQREIVVLRVVVGLSAKETAKALGLTSVVARIAQHQALTRSRKRLAGGRLSAPAGSSTTAQL